jgi:hypothetical protein
MFESPPSNSRQDRNEKLFRPREWSAFCYCRIPTKLSLVVVIVGECQLLYLSQPAAMRGEKGPKSYFGLRVNCSSLLHYLDQTCSGCGTWGGSATYDLWVAQLQCEARLGRKAIPASRIKCPKLMSDFDETCGGSGKCGGSANVMFELTRCNFGRDSEEKLSRVKCSSLLTYFDKICTRCGVCAGSATWYVSVTKIKCKTRERRKTALVSRITSPALLIE